MLTCTRQLTQMITYLYLTQSVAAAEAEKCSPNSESDSASNDVALVVLTTGLIVLTTPRMMACMSRAFSLLATLQTLECGLEQFLFSTLLLYLHIIDMPELLLIHFSAVLLHLDDLAAEAHRSKQKILQLEQGLSENFRKSLKGMLIIMPIVGYRILQHTSCSMQQKLALLSLAMVLRELGKIMEVMGSIPKEFWFSIPVLLLIAGIHGMPGY